MLIIGLLFSATALPKLVNAASTTYSFTNSTSSFTGYTVSVSGDASVTNPIGNGPGGYGISIDWDNTGVWTNTGAVFSGTNPITASYAASHTYTSGGSKTITILIHHSQPSGHESGSNTLTVTVVLPPENCTDGIDNDGDGLVDLADPDCAAFFPHLIVNKVVTNDNGGAKAVSNFSFQINNGSATPFESDGSNDVSLNVGTYSVSEVADSGYAASYSGDCSNVVLASGNTKTCTITNDDIAPKLTVTKIVTNNDGGEAVVSDFPLFVNGNPVVSGDQNTYNAGNYTVTETNQSGYVGTFSGDCAADGTVTLNPGDVKTCTLTNNDIAPGLTVIKNVTNNNGGTASASDFNLFVNSTQVVNGDSTTFPAGNYTVTETGGPAGYVGTFSGDCDESGNVTLGLGETKVCVLTNDDTAPSLTLIKQVDNGNSGVAIATDWTLYASGPTSISGAGGATSDSTFNAGTYALSESTGPVNYSAGAWSCDGGVQDGSSVTLGLDESATCTMVNTFVPVLGCTDPAALNYNSSATAGNDEANDCTYPVVPVLGCTDAAATNYNPLATEDNGSCTYPVPDVCPNIDGVQASLPSGFHHISNGNCVRNSSDGSIGSIPQPQGQVLGESICGVAFNGFLRRGYQNNTDAVKKVQEFLNQFLNAGISVDGKFGPLTEKFVKKFQEMPPHDANILFPWGIKKGTGIVFRTTSVEINNMFCPDLKLPTPAHLTDADNWSKSSDVPQR